MCVMSRRHQVPASLLQNGSSNWCRSHSDDSFFHDCNAFYFHYLCWLGFDYSSLGCRFLIHFSQHPSTNNGCFGSTWSDWSRSCSDDGFVWSCLVLSALILFLNCFHLETLLSIWLSIFCLFSSLCGLFRFLWPILMYITLFRGFF